VSLSEWGKGQSRNWRRARVRWGRRSRTRFQSRAATPHFGSVGGNRLSGLSCVFFYLLPDSLNSSQVFAGAPRSPSTSSFNIPPNGASLLVHSLLWVVYSWPPALLLVFDLIRVQSNSLVPILTFSFASLTWHRFEMNLYFLSTPPNSLSFRFTNPSATAAKTNVVINGDSCSLAQVIAPF
jgi:hypothetical protein